jgi:L-fuconolactonase
VDLAVRDQPWTVSLEALRRSFAFDQLRPYLSRAGIDATVLVQTITVAEETVELLALAAAHSEIRDVVGWLDLTADGVAARLDQGESDPRWLLRDDVTRGLRAVADAGLVYDLLVTAARLPAAIEAVRRHPGLRFVLDHGGNPRIASGQIGPWRSHIGALADLPNVVVKLSGVLTEAPPPWTADDIRPYADKLPSSFGALRTMFGSDWLRADYEDIVAVTEDLTVRCSPAEQAEIFGTAAIRWYELAEAPR